MEAQLEQYEQRVKDLAGMKSKLEEENEMLKVSCYSEIISFICALMSPPLAPIPSLLSVFLLMNNQPH